MSRVLWRQWFSRSNVLKTLGIEKQEFIQKHISTHLKNSFWYWCKWFSELVSRIIIIKFFRFLGQLQWNTTFQTPFFFISVSWQCWLNIILFLRKFSEKLPVRTTSFSFSISQLRKGRLDSQYNLNIHFI